MWRKFGALAAGGFASFSIGSVTAEYDPAWVGMKREEGFSPKEFRKFQVLKKSKVSHDTEKVTFALQTTNHTTGMTLASMIVTRFKDEDGKNVVRPYTPISPLNGKATFDLLVKKYPGGKMGTHIHDLKMGDYLEVKGPFSKIDIQPNSHEHIGMIAGGSGITPMYQIINHLLSDYTDNTKLSLIYANKTPGDILLHRELIELERMHPRFKVYYTVQDAPYQWEGGIGVVTKGVVNAYMPKPGEGKLLVCGPPGMMKHVSGDKDFGVSPPTQGAVEGLLKESGYSADDVYKF